MTQHGIHVFLRDATIHWSTGSHVWDNLEFCPDLDIWVLYQKLGKFQKWIFLKNVALKNQNTIAMFICSCSKYKVQHH